MDGLKKSPKKPHGKNANFYTIAGAAQFLGVGYPALRRAMRDGTLNYCKMGGRFLIPRQALEDFTGYKIERIEHKDF